PRGEHQGHEEVIAARQLAHHDEGAHRYVREAAIERSHSDQCEGPRVDGRILEDDGGRSAKSTAEQCTEHERGAEVTRAAPGADRERGGEKLGEAQEQEQLGSMPAGRHPAGARDRYLRRSVSPTQYPERASRATHPTPYYEDERDRE